MSSMRNKRIVFAIFFILAILVVFLFALNDGTFSRKVVDSSSPIPSGICKDCNVVLISIDTLRADHLPCYGYEKNTAPNICALAKDSVFFKEPYSVSAWTYPSHYSMLTGLYPDDFIISARGQGQAFANDTVMIQKILKDESYSTGAYTGGGYVTQKLGFSREFNSWVQSKGPDRFLDNAPLVDSWIKGQSNNFFLFLHGYDVHGPYEKIPVELRFKYLDKSMVSKECYRVLSDSESKSTACNREQDRYNYSISQYEAAIYGADEYVGQVISELKAKGVYDKTIIIITADHGERFGERGLWGHGDTIYRELINVPLIIRIPDVAGREVDTPVSNLDIAPTILDLLGVENNYNMDGKSLLPIINGGEGRPVYAITARNYEDSKAVRDRSFGFWYSIIEDKLKLIIAQFNETSEKEMYNLNSDWSEKVNLVNNSDYSEKFKELDKKLLEWKQNRNLNNRAPEVANPDEEVDEELIAQLRSLGYLS